MARSKAAPSCLEFETAVVCPVGNGLPQFTSVRVLVVGSGVHIGVEQGPGFSSEWRVVILEEVSMTVPAVQGARLDLVGVVAEDLLDEAWSLPPGAGFVSTRGALEPHTLSCLVVGRLGTALLVGQGTLLLLFA